MRNTTWREYIITRLIKVSGYSAILCVGLIFLFLLQEGAPALIEIPIPTLFSTRWYPIRSHWK